jgi:hypothetical protein
MLGVMEFRRGFAKPSKHEMAAISKINIKI